MSAVLDRIVPKTMTADDFAQSPFAESHELVKGELYPTMPSGSLHGIITNRLNRLVSNFVVDNNLGEVFAAETGFRLNEHSLVGADTAFVGREKLARFGVPDSFFPTAPDLAVEVVSPSNTSDEVTGKVEDYLSAGSDLVWIVYPKRKVVVVYRPNNTVGFLHESDELDGEEVLPGFRCPLEKIFGNLPEVKDEQTHA